MRKYLLLGMLLLSSPSLANWTGKDAGGNIITFFNAGNCTSVVCVPIAQLTDGSGNAIGVTGSPLYFNFATGATLPAFASTPTVTAIQPTASLFNITCANCSGSGASGTDAANFTAGSSIFAPSGGFFQTTATNNPLTNGEWGTLQLTANRAAFVNLRTAAGAEIGTAASPVQVSLANTAANGTAVTVAPSTLAAWGLTASTQNGATPTNSQLVMGQFNTNPTAITSGNVSPFQLDSAGNLLVNIKAGFGSVFGPTAVGSTNVNPPIVIGGTLTGAAGQNVEGVAVNTSGQMAIQAPPSLPLPTGSATAALQGTNSATTAHTCSTAGYSILGCLGQIDDDAKGSIVAGTNTIGNVGSDPSQGKSTPTEKFLALPATTTTQIIALSGTTSTYITSALVMAGGTVNVTFKYGTGTNCGTGTTTLSGPWPLTAQAGFSKGAGVGAVMIVPAGQALCITTDASVSGGVDLTYQQI